LNSFANLGLSKEILEAIGALGFEEATPIQSQAIPLAITGKDVLGQAPTGTGKTVAFGIPLIERVERFEEGPQGLVITPTRELAIQVAEELNKIGQYKRIYTLPIYGGQDINRQIRALKKRPQIIVGTPGRLMDHMRRRTLKLHGMTMVVLDEADEMLNMGFLEDIQFILQAIPQHHQTMLFSATIPPQIRKLAGEFMEEPHIIQVAPKEVTVSNTEQYYVEIHEGKKFDTLCNLLDLHAPTSAIIFSRTKKRVDEVAQALNIRGYSAEGLHGDLTQARRDSVMGQFRTGNTEILVATDVAARGLDIGGVTHVYNYDIPQDPESYVHRVGRTGRAGASGIAITLVTPREMSQLKNIERLIKRKIKRMPAPTLSEALVGQQQIAFDRLLKTARESSIKEYTALAESLLDEADSISLVAAALKLITKEPNTTPVEITQERPPQRKYHHQRQGYGRPKKYGQRKYR
jgi:ATP-dependent RNA helicase DeaD